MRTLATCALLLLIIAKVAGVLLLGPVPIELDAVHYWHQSTLVLGGDLLLLDDPIAYRTPIYPWFLAAVRMFAGRWSLVTLAAVQGALWIATVVILARLASRITKLPSAFALTLLAWLPALSGLTFAASVLTESVFVFWLSVHLLAVVQYIERPTAPRCVWIGVTFALTLLTRPIVIFLWVAHLTLLAWVHFRHHRFQAVSRISARSRLFHAGLTGLACFLMVCPWLGRNAALFGNPFITEFVGRNIWIVTFQDGSGAGLELPATDSSDQLRRRFKAVGQPIASEDYSAAWRHTWTTSEVLVQSGLSDPQADQLMKQVCIETIKENPGVFGYKAIRRMWNFWRCVTTNLPEQNSAIATHFNQQTWGWQIPWIRQALRYRFSQSLWLNTGLMLVLGAAVCLLVINRPTRPCGVWLFLILAYFTTITGLVEIPAYRYRVVVEPLVASAIGSAAAVLLSWRSRPAIRAAAR